ncbi:MAG: anaerobic ribonucleoside-triphosphate reductase [Candidatus Lokiarchaeota archaeon]|nr:anaerobic ribonucleoside-triphosphate reductase [Candidatus Lokiarchaeota archaeon]MBD3198878.1 anaerobic ribonucleoside-triphosphate reductase [Candidatus Lokiarchaeota archaeon]
MVISQNSDQKEEAKKDFLNNLLPRVFRTEGDWVQFDPSKIRDSIIHETSLDSHSAEKITELTVRRIISSGIKFLSGPHIREIVCSILSEQHYEEERKLYTRIGMPLMDYEAILEYGINENANQDMNPESIHHWAANKISEEYALLRILNSEEAHAHLYGDIHVHMLRYFDLRPFCQEWDPRMILENGLPPVDSWAHCSRSGPAGSLRVAVTHLAKWLGIIQGEFSGGLGYDYVTTFLAPYARGLSDREVEQSMQCLIFETNQIFAARGGQVPFTSISCTPTVPQGLLDIPAIGPKGRVVGTYGDYKEECLKLFDTLTDVYIQGDHNGKLFAFPKHEVKIKKEWLKEFESSYLKLMKEAVEMGTPYFLNMCPEWMPDEIHSQCCRKFLRGDEIISKCELDKDSRKLKGVWENYVTIGSLQSVSLNLPRYAYLSEDEDKYFEILDDKMELCAQILRKKWVLMKKRLETGHLPLCSGKINGQSIFKMQDQNLSIGFTGLNEAVQGLTGQELHKSESVYNLGKRILTYMVAKCNSMTERDGYSYSLWEQPAESSSGRFARLDLKHFPKKAIPQSSGESAYYTNSSHFRYDAEMPLYERIRKQGDYHPIVSGGVISHIWLGEQKPDIDGLWELTKNICLNTNTAYFSYTTDFTFCTHCCKMYRGGQWICPDCNTKDVKVYSRITGYYSEVNRYNDGKMAEWQSRKRYGIK